MSTRVRPRLRADEYRWSLACRCPRMAVLQRRGTPQAETTRRQRRIRKRGLLFEELVAEEFAAEFGADNIVRQKDVLWPGGVLHPDVYIVSEGCAIEIKSSTHPSSLRADAELQNAGHQHYDPDCQSGGLVFVNPVDLDQDFRPVDARTYVEQIEAIEEQLAWAEETGGLPECSAESPTACRLGKFCPYTELAWEGWSPPPPGVIEDPYVAKLAAELYRLRQAKKAGDAEANRGKAHIAALQESLLALGLEAGADYRAGPLNLHPIYSRPSHVEYDKGGHTWIRVDRVSDDPLPLPEEDYGDVPF